MRAIAGKRCKTDEQRELIERIWRREADSDKLAEQVQTILREGEVIEKARELRNAYEEQAIRSLRFLKNPTLKGLLRRVVGKIFPRTIIEGYCSEFETRNASSRETRSESAR